MRVTHQKTLEFINSCNCIVNYIELEKAIIWYQVRPSCRLKKIYMHSKYPTISLFKEKLHVHRLLMQYWLNKKLNTKEYVNHINGDKLDSRKENLEVLPATTHQSITNKGRKQSLVHVMKRINATSLTRYGKIVYESPELLTQLQ